MIVPFKIDVEPRNAAKMTEQQAAPYLGSWAVRFYDDSKQQESPEMKMEMLLGSGTLRGVVEGPQPFAMEFLPEPDGTFLIAFLEDGKVVDVETATPITFDMQNGRATRWSAKAVKGIGDKPWIWGTRRP